MSIKKLTCQAYPSSMADGYLDIMIQVDFDDKPPVGSIKTVRNAHFKLDFDGFFDEVKFTLKEYMKEQGLL